MSVKIKICGIRTRDALTALIDGGADYFGLVFYDPSPRNVAVETAAELVAIAEGRALSVALLVDPSIEEAVRITEKIAPAYIQLHGHESPELVSQLKRATGRPVIKAVSVGGPGDVEAALAYGEVADIVLYDALAAQSDGNGLPGGNGIAFDWRLLEGVKDKGQFMLSGGLTPDNVAAAIALTHAPIVDVSSGVEATRGHKDPELIARFITAARTAPQLG